MVKCRHSLLTRLFSSACVRWSSSVYALSSGRGKCGVAVIRVSGPDSGPALLKITECARLPAARRAAVRALYHPRDGQLLDRGLVLWLPGPSSFTGEDSCELHTHGGPAVVAAVLDALSALPGLGPAQPGEFTRRAFHAGKLDITQVEGLADLIHAETERQRRQAVRQAGGELSRLYAGWRQRLLKLIAAAEAFIDFSEEEQIDEGLLPDTMRAAAALQRDIDAHLNDARRGERLRHGVQVCIGGAVNAGKSSLLNRLVQRDASIVSASPGTTRDTLESMLDIAGYPVMLTDTAGLRDASDAVEREGVQRARDRLHTADLQLLVVDCTEALHWMRQCQRPCSAFIDEHLAALDPRLAALETQQVASLVVFNKCDLLSVDDRAALESWTGGAACLMSCTTGQGLSACLSALEGQLQLLCDTTAAGDGPAPTRHRHTHHLTRTAHALQHFHAHTHADLALAVQSLRTAVKHLGHVTGHVSAEHVLDVLFSDFCIGK